MRKYIYLLFLIIFSFLTTSCESNYENQSRSFFIGVTPWPADFTVAEVDTSYAFINQHCDIVSHHFDEGIPYEEAFTNTTMPTELQNDVNYRKLKTSSDKKILLSIAPLNITRLQKADYYRNSTISQSIKDTWNVLSINHPNVITAYVNYVNFLIEQLNPNYINYGVESNSLLFQNSDFQLYKSFISQVYTQLKNQHPNKVFFVSFMVDESNEGFTNAQQLLPYTDIIGLSSYPYITISSSTNGNTNPDLFPANYYERYINMANKPFAFAETGYIAENLTIPSYSLDKQGNETWQNKFLIKIFELSNQYDAEFVIWFCSKDYDAAKQTMINLGLYNDLFGFWQDTGLKNENGTQRLSYKTWISWKNKQKT